MTSSTLAGPAPLGPKLPGGEAFWNAPNIITLSRLGLAFVVYAGVAYGYFFTALIVFVVASLTDALDGFVARRFGQATAIGRQLDPLVDKVINCGSYIYLLTIPTARTGLFPWMVTTIVVRELLIQGLRSHLEGGGQPFGAQWAGKAKTFCQCVSIGLILGALWLQPDLSQPLVRLNAVRDLATWLAVGLTIYSGLGYFWLAVTRFRVS